MGTVFEMFRLFQDDEKVDFVRPLPCLLDSGGDTTSVIDALDIPETVWFPWWTVSLYLSKTPRANKLVAFDPFRSSSAPTPIGEKSQSSSLLYSRYLSSTAMPGTSLRLPAYFDDRGIVKGLSGVCGFLGFEEVPLLCESKLGLDISAGDRF